MKLQTRHKLAVLLSLAAAVFVILHYNDVIMSAMESQSTSLTIVYSNFYSGADQRKFQSSASLAFVRGIHRWPVNSPLKRPVTRKMFPFDDVTMSKQQPQGGWAIVSSHGDSSRFRKKWQYQWTTDDNVICHGVILVVSLLYLFVLIPWSSPHYFLSINIALLFPSLTCMLLFFGWQRSVTPKNVFMKNYIENGQIIH